MSTPQDRVLFANQLRGIAVLAVMFVHWCGIFWFSRDLVSSYIYAPVTDQPASSLIFLLTPPTVNYGALGVSIFFLLSGFVIPFSLSKANPLEFLVSRVFRIYPTYIAGSALMLLCVWLSARYWGRTFEMDTWRLVSNLLLLNTNMLQGSIDLVNWTLSVEIKFYIVSALLYRSIRASKDWHLVAFALAALLLSLSYPDERSLVAMGSYHLSINSLKTELMCVTYMMIGTGFYFVHNGTLKPSRFCLYAAVMASIFYVSWQHSEWKSQPITIMYNYFYSLGLFSLFFLLRHKARPCKPLDFLANISYPIYVTHSIIGYSLLRIQMDLGILYREALVSTFVIIILLSWGLHVTVERHTLRVGKRLFRPALPIKPPATT